MARVTRIWINRNVIRFNRQPKKFILQYSVPTSGYQTSLSCEEIKQVECREYTSKFWIEYDYGRWIEAIPYSEMKNNESRRSKNQMEFP